MVEAFKITGGKEIKRILEWRFKKCSSSNYDSYSYRKGTYILKNVPNLMDIRTLVKLLESLGLIIEKLDNNTYKIENKGLTNLVAGYELVKKWEPLF